jgi:prephenate dehydrogenase
LSALDGLIDGLGQMRTVVASDDRAGLQARLQRAREARANLPVRANHPAELAEVRIPILDRPGSAAEIFTLAAELGVNIESFEVVHTMEGTRGVAVVLVDAAIAEMYRGGLMARGYRPAVQRLA